MQWFFLALASALIFATQELLMRILSIRTGSPRIFALVFNLWGAAFSVIVLLLQGQSLAALGTLHPVQYLLLASTVIIYGLYERTHFFARRAIDASTFAIIFRLSTVIGFIGAIVFLGESLSPVKIIGVTLIIFASLLLVFRNPKFKKTPALGYALLSAFFLGLTSVLDKPASAPLPSALYSFVVWCFPLIIIAYPGVRAPEILREFRIGGWNVAFAALCNVVGYILYVEALLRAEASRVNPIESTSSILTVLGGIILLHERDHLWRKLAAGAIAFAGVLLIRL